MKRRDSLASLFSGHGSKILFEKFDEDEGLLTDNEEDIGVSPLAKESEFHPSCVVDKADVDSSSSWFIQTDSEPEEINCDHELRTQNLVNRRLGSRERLNRSLSDLFARVGRPKIQTRRTKCVVRQQESKIFENVDQVSLKWCFCEVYSSDIWVLSMAYGRILAASGNFPPF